MIKKTTDIFWIAGLCLLFSGVFCATNAKADTMAASSESNSSVPMAKTFLKPQHQYASKSAIVMMQQKDRLLLRHANRSKF